MMVTEHSGVIDRATATGRTAGVTPRDNPISMAMTQQAAGIARELEGLPDQQVDVRYLEHQIALHGNTLSMLDHVLIPNADNDAIESLFEQARPAVRQHMERAMALHHQMTMSGTNR
jgi:predicted outer membrane protein